MADYYIDYTPYQDVLYEDNNLNLGVGVEEPQYPLDVRGTMGCDELVVSKYAEIGSNLRIDDSGIKVNNSVFNLDGVRVLGSNLHASNVTCCNLISRFANVSNITSCNITSVVGNISMLNSGTLTAYMVDTTYVTSSSIATSFAQCTTLTCPSNMTASSNFTGSNMSVRGYLRHTNHGSNVIDTDGKVPWVHIKNSPFVESNNIVFCPNFASSNFVTYNAELSNLVMSGVLYHSSLSNYVVDTDGYIPWSVIKDAPVSEEGGIDIADVLLGALGLTILGYQWFTGSGFGQSMLDELYKRFTGYSRMSNEEGDDAEGQSVTSNVYMNWLKLYQNPIASKPNSYELALQSNVYLLAGNSKLCSMQPNEVIRKNPESTSVPRFSVLPSSIASSRTIIECTSSSNFLHIDRAHFGRSNTSNIVPTIDNTSMSYGSNVLWDFNSNLLRPLEVNISNGKLRIMPNGSITRNGLMLVDSNGAYYVNGVEMITRFGEIKAGGHVVIDADGYLDPRYIRKLDINDNYIEPDDDLYSMNFSSLIEFDKAFNL
jgi:hypothetical protein